MLTLAHFLTLGAILFCLGVAGIFVNRKNVILLLMCIELMLLAVNMNFVAFSRYVTPPDDISGQIIALFGIVLAAAEAAVFLAIILAIYREFRTISPDETDTLKG